MKAHPPLPTSSPLGCGDHRAPSEGGRHQSNPSLLHWSDLFERDRVPVQPSGTLVIRFRPLEQYTTRAQETGPVPKGEGFWKVIPPGVGTQFQPRSSDSRPIKSGTAQGRFKYAGLRVISQK